MGCLSDKKDAQKVTSLHMTDMNQSPRTQMIASVKQDASVNIFNEAIIDILSYFSLSSTYSTLHLEKSS